jgi:hypothetical protein
MTNITINGVNFTLAEGLALDIDMHGNVDVYIDGDHEEPTGYGPGPTLIDLLTARNPILDGMASRPSREAAVDDMRQAAMDREAFRSEYGEPCECDDCAEEYRWAAAREQAIHDTRMHILSEVGNILTDGDLLNVARELKNGPVFVAVTMTNDPTKV